jgi:hypothetical protein
MTITIGAGGGGVFIESEQQVTANTTLVNGTNYMSIGPITINSGITVTVNAGATWTVV